MRARKQECLNTNLCTYWCIFIYVSGYAQIHRVLRYFCFCMYNLIYIQIAYNVK